MYYMYGRVLYIKNKRFFHVLPYPRESLCPFEVVLAALRMHDATAVGSPKFSFQNLYVL